MEGVRSTCPYCGVGCGVIAQPDGTIIGDPDHPANFGRLCSKGSALGDTLSLEDRLLSPQIDGREADWDEALTRVAKKFQSTIRDHGPDSVAFYVSGQLLTEDYYVANKLMKGFIGSANIDTNSRLCMASSVAGHKRAFGTDTVPGTYEDLEEADLIVLVGSNLAWCHPVLFQRISAAKQARPKMKVVNIDPRKTATCDLADIHLALNPGTDVALFNGLLAQIAERDAQDPNFAAHINNAEAAIASAKSDDPSITGLAQSDLETFYNLWINTQKTVTIYSQGVNQSAQGTDKVNAILNCHLATGRIGKPGMGPFSVTGQPNAMGGREVGGLANMLACHLDLENQTHRQTVKEFWDAPTIPNAQGLKAVDMFDAIESGQIKALWVMSTNPAVSMPDATRVRAAIKNCDFVVVSDIIAKTDTAALADVLLPAAGWGEKSGTVTNSDRTISRQRPFLAHPSNTRPDWQIICDVASRMGWHAQFDYQSPAEIFREYAALSGHAAALGKDFDISGFAEISESQFANLEPIRWPVAHGKSSERFFADGQFFTPNGKANMLPVAQAALPKRDAQYPYRLNSGRIRDQWHTMTRTAKSAKLSQHLAEPFLEIHPEDARDLALEQSTLAEVKGPHGTAILRVLITDRTPRGTVFAPIHWTAQWSSNGRIDDLVAPVTDPISGQPDLKGAPVSIAPLAPAWYGFAVSAQDVAPRTAYWAKARFEGGLRAELAGHNTPQNWSGYAQDVFGLTNASAISVSDAAHGTARVVLSDETGIKAALFVSKTPVELSRSFVLSAFQNATPAKLITGKPGKDQPDPGATICSCFAVGINTITSAIATQNLTSLEAIGAATQAGTNCGSCRPELRALLHAAPTRMAAE